MANTPIVDDVVAQGDASNARDISAGVTAVRNRREQEAAAAAQKSAQRENSHADIVLRDILRATGTDSGLGKGDSERTVSRQKLIRLAYIDWTHRERGTAVRDNPSFMANLLLIHGNPAGGLKGLNPSELQQIKELEMVFSTNSRHPRFSDHVRGITAGILRASPGTIEHMTERALYRPATFSNYTQVGQTFTDPVTGAQVASTSVIKFIPRSSSTPPDSTLLAVAGATRGTPQSQAKAPTADRGTPASAPDRQATTTVAARRPSTRPAGHAVLKTQATAMECGTPKPGEPIGQDAHFAVGSTALSAADKRALQTVISDFQNRLGRDATAKLQVVGFADSSGALGDNIRLSHQRAEAVRAYLVSQGMKADQIVTVTGGVGGADPSNRKVVFSTISEQVVASADPSKPASDAAAPPSHGGRGGALAGLRADQARVVADGGAAGGIVVADRAPESAAERRRALAPMAPGL
ncbi:MAG: OmpA family protein [Alphaproteobacteria bacterium]